MKKMKNKEWIFVPLEEFKVDISGLDRDAKIVKINEFRITDDYRCEWNNEFIQDSTELIVIKGEWVFKEGEEDVGSEGNNIV